MTQATPHSPRDTRPTVAGGSQLSSSRPFDFRDFRAAEERVRAAMVHFPVVHASAPLDVIGKDVFDEGRVFGAWRLEGEDRVFLRTTGARMWEWAHKPDTEKEVEKLRAWNSASMEIMLKRWDADRDRIAALEAALVRVVGLMLPATEVHQADHPLLRSEKEFIRGMVKDTLDRLGLAHRLHGNPTEAEQVTA